VSEMIIRPTMKFIDLGYAAGAGDGLLRWPTKKTASRPVCQNNTHIRVSEYSLG
jgi:hypothetical protein